MAFFAEIKQLIRLATPLLAAQLLSTATGVVDTIMSGHYHANDLAAVAIGNSLWLPLFLLISGLLIATTSMVARFHGAGDKAAIVTTTQQSIWMALLASLVASGLLINIDLVLGWLQLEPELVRITDGYLFAIAFGMPAAAIFNGLRGFTEGMGRTKPYMISSLLAFLANIPLNYALIYGVWGLPEMGGVGCGWATAMSMWMQVLVLGWFTSRSADYGGVSLYRHWQWPQLAEIRKVFKLGFPIAIAVFAEVSIFSAIALLLAPLGALMVAGHQVALSVSHMIFMLPLSLAQAITIRVGFFLGRDQQVLANNVARTGIMGAVLLSMMTMLLILSFRETIVGWFTSDIEVQALAASLFVFMAIYQLPDHVQIAANAALRAYHDTRVPLFLILLAYWVVALPLGYTLARTDLIVEAIAAKGFWLGLLAGLSITSVLLTRRLYKIASRPMAASPKPAVDETS